MRWALAIFLSCGWLIATHAEPWTLQHALQYARTNAPDTRIMRQRIVSASALLQQANAAYWPQLQLHSSYIRSDNPVTVFGMALNQRSYSDSLDFNNVPDADNWNVRGVLMVPLYAGGRNKAAREGAKAASQAAEADAEAVRNALEFEITRTYASMVKARKFIEVAEASVHSFETNRAIAQSRFNAGTILRTELLDLDVRLGQAMEDLIRARNASTLTGLSLRNLLGLQEGSVEILGEPALGREPEKQKINLHPELRALDRRTRAAESEVRRAQGGYLPRLDAFGQLEQDLGLEFDGNGKSYSAGVVAQWDLWDGNRTRGKVREARANLEELREQEAKLRLGIELEAEQARLRLVEAQERLKVTSQTVNQAEESVRLIRLRFEQGLALATQLIDAETALTAAQVRSAEALTDRTIAMAALRKAYGLPQLEGF